MAINREQQPPQVETVRVFRNERGTWNWEQGGETFPPGDLAFLLAYGAICNANKRFNLGLSWAQINELEKLAETSGELALERQPEETP